MFDGCERRCAGAALEARDGHVVGARFGNARGDRADAHFRYELDREASCAIGSPHQSACGRVRDISAHGVGLLLGNLLGGWSSEQAGGAFAPTFGAAAAVCAAALLLFVLGFSEAPEPDPAAPVLIHSIRGFGYTFEPRRAMAGV